MDTWLFSLINIFIGWLLGLLGPAIVHRIKRDYRISELKIALENELHELQYIMALSSCLLKAYSNELTDDFIQWLEVIVLNYKGNEPNKDIKQQLEKLKQTASFERYKVFYPNGNIDIGLAITSQITPLLDSHANEIATMPIAYQKKLLNIKRKLHICNQRISHLQKKLNDTFDSSLLDDNHKKVIAELRVGYRNLGDSCKLIAELI